MGSRYKDLTGEKFGKLLVLKLTDKRKDNSKVWKCLCDCGKEHFVNTKHLKRGCIYYGLSQNIEVVDMENY